MMKSVVSLFLLSLLVGMPAFAVNNNSNRRAPGWALPDTNYKFHDLMDYRGKVLLIEFMQTSCPHCQEATSNLKSVTSRFGQNVVMVHIINPPSSMQDVKNYMTKNLLTSPFLFDSGQVAASYLQLSPQNPGFDVPHLFVVDQEGKIVNDFEWSDATKSVFLGDGLVPILTQLTKKPSSGRK